MSKNPKNRWKYLIWTEKNVVSSERLEELQTQNFRLKLPTAFFLLPSIKCTHVQICWENSYYPLQLGQLGYMLSLAVRKVLQFIISLAIVNIVLKMKRSIFRAVIGNPTTSPYLINACFTQSVTQDIYPCAFINYAYKKYILAKFRKLFMMIVKW